MVARLRALMLLAIVPAAVAPAAAQTDAGDPIRYVVSFPAPQTHYVDVRATFPTLRRPQIELMMAVWTPGSYLVREFSRNVEEVGAAGPDGRPLAIDKSVKNRWRIGTGGAPTVTVHYRVYARELTMRTNWVDADFALLNGAPTFITLADRAPRPHEVTIQPAPSWRQSVTGLPELAGGAHRYRAPDFDTLVDSPILVGNPSVREFSVEGTRHALATIGNTGMLDEAQAARDFEKIVREHRRLWGVLPYDRYLMLNILTETPTGGLEHRNSAVLVMNRWIGTPRAYLTWLSYLSHEHFHAWNVKRLRPVELGPFEYESEVYTRSLWIAEGVTEYYSHLTLHRAGLSTREDLLDALSNEIERLQASPGRFVRSAAEASFDAWIKYYRPDENSVNASVDYYTKGVVLGLLLDARIRKATGGARGLDDVLRAAYQRYAGPKGYTPDEFRAVAESVAGTSLRPFWESSVDGTAELDYADLADTLGLRFQPAAPTGRAWLGMTTRNDAGRLIVSQVRRDTPAYAAGLDVDDEIIAIGDFRVRADQLNNRLEQYAPGDTVALLVARREQIRRIEVALGQEPPRRWRLEADPLATDHQQQQRARWLRPAS
ncbi:MAG: M61 family metallopeptidase [Acidobacteria bacterium]|nr:M61 family metallopeptidase [Acidobacteriota bacterium]